MPISLFLYSTVGRIRSEVKEVVYAFQKPSDLKDFFAFPVRVIIVITLRWITSYPYWLTISKSLFVYMYQISSATTHIAQNIAETCQKYFQSFIAIEILPQHFCQLFQNISLQNYNFNFLKYFCK